MLFLAIPTLATVGLVSCGLIFAVPVLVQGFKRRGKGVKYERNFLIQRAPQLASVATIGIVVISHLEANSIFKANPVGMLFSITTVLTPALAPLTSWLGVGILISGLIFMIGGWYSLGDCFSTDAEVLDGHTVRKTGLLKYVMHPAYSGIIQSLLGASLAANSPLGVIATVFVVAPLWLRRAKYEEQILLESLGPSYKEYAEELRWRRLVPRFIPIGV